MFVFVILHYKNINDTTNCINSIHNALKKSKYKIVVVDNGSNIQNDIDTLSKLDIDLLVNDKNLGFANGNNAGCKYAISKYNPDFLAVINSDILIEQPNFIKKINDIYKKYEFDIFGPKIITYGGDSCNPFPVYKTIEQVDKNIDKSNKLIKIYGNVFLRNLLKLYINTKRIFIKPRRLENGRTTLKGVALHGCALIFSKKYIEKYENIFYPGTFLFHEEEFLEQRRVRDNLITIYSPDVELIHKEGGSLNNRFGSEEYKKLIFKNKEIIKSLTKLKKVMISKKE
jgi:GT2 family glycosyltransferase